MSYATTDEYLALYPDTEKSEDWLEAWLERAAKWLDVQLGDRLDPEDESQLDALNYVNIELVRRMDASPFAGMGVDSFQQTANGFQESLQFHNTAGGFNLLPSERKSLGLASSIGFGSWLGGE